MPCKKQNIYILVYQYCYCNALLHCKGEGDGKNNTNKTKTLKKMGEQKSAGIFIHASHSKQHPNKTSTQNKKNPTPSKFLPSHLIPPQTFRGA